MINISKQMKQVVCAGLVGAVVAYLLDAYIQMTVHNVKYHFMFGYLDGMIAMGMILIYLKYHVAPSPRGA